MVSAQNGLNELAIAEVVGARAHGRRVRQLRRRLPGAGRDSLRRPRRGGGRRDRRPHHAARRPRSATRGATSTPRAIVDAQHLGLPVGQGSLRRDALRHGAHQRVDRRRARHARVPARCTSRWRARSSPSRRRAASRPRRSTASIPRPTCRGAGAARRRARSTTLVAHNRRSAKTHSGIWRDLAVRKRPHRGRRAARHRRDARRRGRRADAAHRAPGRADPRDRDAARARSRSRRWTPSPRIAPERSPHEPRLHAARPPSSPAPRTASAAPSPGVRRARRARLGVRRARGRAARDGSGSAAPPADRAARASWTCATSAAVDAFVAEASAASGRVRHPREQRRRRARTGGPAARGGHARGVAGHLRRQRDRRVLLLRRPWRRA